MSENKTRQILEVKINDEVKPLLDVLYRKLSDRSGLHSYIAAEAETLTREHMRTIDPVMHSTRAKLGVTSGNPPSYWEARIKAVESRSDSNSAVVSLGREAEIFARVDGPVTITPRTGKFLTIPLKAMSYGKRAREIADLFPVTFKKTGKSVLARKGADGKLEMVYALKEKVTLPMERRLLPSDEAYQLALQSGVEEYIKDATEGDNIA